MVATSTVKSVTFLLCLGVVVFFGGLAVIPACLLFLAIPHYGLSATTTIVNYFVASFCALVTVSVTIRAYKYLFSVVVFLSAGTFR